jgi:hypothetical protein
LHKRLSGAAAYNIKFDPIGVANIQRRLHALEHTFYVWFVLWNLAMLIRVELM